MKTHFLMKQKLSALTRRALSTLLLAGIGVAVQAQPRLYSWGHNGQGQLGDGTTTSRRVPGSVKAPPGNSALDGVRTVSAGDSFSVAVRTDGTVYAWGYNAFGQLGNNTTANSLKPVQVHGPDNVGFLTDVASATATQYCTFALKTDGTVWAWGYNGTGQLGDNTNTNRLTPVQVHGPGNVGFLTNVTQVAAGENHTLAVRSDGTLWGWGYNSYGELGDSVTTARRVPTQVRGPNGVGFLTDVITAAAGYYFSIAVKSDGTVWGFGYNAYNQLGDGTTTNRSFPVQIHGPNEVGFLTDVIAVAANDWHALALKSDGSVWGWGWNAYGQVGDGTTTQHATPVQVRGVGNNGFLSGIRALSTSANSSIAVGQDGLVYGWGYDSFGTFGDNAPGSHSTPVQMHGPGNVGLLTEVSGASIGLNHSAVVRSDGTVWSSGYGYYGQLATDTTNNSTTPVRAIGPEGLEVLPDAQSVVSRGNHTVVLKTDGTVFTFGNNTYGQLGDGTTTNRSIATQVVGPGGVGFLTDVVAVSAADWNTVALKADGTVWAWGWNGGGLLGDGTQTSRYFPVQVHGPGNVGFLTNIIAIAAGPYHTLALRRDGAVFGWGYNGYGQLGDNTLTGRLTPVQMLGINGTDPIRGAVALSAGLYYSLVLGSNGTVLACGRNDRGQLGDGTTIDRPIPVRAVGVGGVGNLNSIVSITASNYYSVALSYDGTVVCWGDNDYGQLGNNTTTDSLTPVRVVGPGGMGLLGEVAAISIGANHSMAVKFDGTVWGWGYNAYGQLGDNTLTQRNAPVQAVGPDGVGLLNNIITIGAADYHSIVISGEGAIQGSVILQNSACSGIPIRFQFRPVNGTPFERIVLAGPLGLFSFTNVPPGEYDVAVKGSKWLQRTVHVNTTANNILNLRIFLLTGDANDDNACDVLDLDALIQAFDTVEGDPNWNMNADFNCDESVDVLDLDLILQNFDLTGDA